MKMKTKSALKPVTLAWVCLSMIMWCFAAEQKDETQTLTGEVVDLMCYLDHGAKGEKHRECAETCIKSGGPVGLLVGDKVYLVIGEHKPINDQLASMAAQTVTVKGKVVEHGGMRMIENVEIAKK